MKYLKFVQATNTRSDIRAYFSIACLVRSPVNLAAESEHEAWESITTNNTYFLVYNGQKVGYMAYRRERRGDSNIPTAYLAELAIIPEFQGQGIGSEALQYLDSLLWKNGTMRCILLTHPDNKPALALYHKNGFQETGVRIENYEESGTPRIELKRMDDYAMT